MSTEPAQIIVVDKTEELTRRLSGLLSDRPLSVSRETNVDKASDRFEDDACDVLVITSSAFRAGEIDGVEMLEVIAAESPNTQVVFLVRSRDIRAAMSAAKAGPCAYARLPIEDEELRLLIEAAVDRSRADAAARTLAKRQGKSRFASMVGRSEKMLNSYRQMRQAALTDIPVLFLGETGTGKDLAAQAIHKQSPRQAGPYVAVNLGALPAELVASELFGHEKGAFTGAVERRMGKFELARDGTVFLDEIGTIDEKIQVSLLRLIEQKKFHRLGGRKAITSNARIIAATNQDLVDAVAGGAFREDLYYRLDVFRITMPPLREREGDIPLLIDAYVKRYNDQFDKGILGIAPECIALLESYDWPGNVRELKNVIQRAVLVCEGEVILPEHLPPRFRPERLTRGKVTFEVGTALYEVEREMIVRTLASARNNKKRAAELLGISRRSLYNKLRRYGIEKN